VNSKNISGCMAYFLQPIGSLLIKIRKINEIIQKKFTCPFDTVSS